MSFNNYEDVVPLIRDIADKLRGDYSEGIIKIIRGINNFEVTIIGSVGVGIPYVPGEIVIRTLNRGNLPEFIATKKPLSNKYLAAIRKITSKSDITSETYFVDVKNKSNTLNDSYFKEDDIAASIRKIFNNGFTKIKSDNEFISATKTIKNFSPIHGRGDCPTPEVIETVLHNLAILANKNTSSLLVLQ